MADSPRELSPYRVLRDPMPPERAYAAVDFAEEEVHLREYWRVLVKHRRLVLAVFLVLVATTAIVTFTTDPLYTGAATIQIERQAPKFAPVQEVQQFDATLGSDKYDYYQTQYEILKSRTVAARVIKALGLDADPRFRGDTKSEGLITSVLRSVRSLFSRPKSNASAPEELGVAPPLIDQYLGMLIIGPVRNSRLVKVSFTSKFPGFSAEVANRHVEEYTNASLEQRLGMTLKAKEFLEKELAKAKDRIDATEAALNKFRKDKDVISLGGDKTDIVSERLGDLNAKFTEAQAERIRLEGQYELIKKRDYESLPDVISSPLVSQLKQAVAKIEGERAELAKKFKPGYPRMAETIAGEAEAQARLDAEIRKIVAGIESSYLAAKTREEKLGVQLEQQRQTALAQKDVGADYDTLKRDVDTARSLYANLLQRLKDVDVAEEIKVSNISVVDPASPPIRPSQPKKLRNLMLASILGLVVGAGLAFFLEYLDNTVKTPEDVEQRLGLPTLGVVPSFDTPALAYGGYDRRKSHARSSGAGTVSGGGGSNGRLTELVVSSHPNSVVSEAYRAIRTGILLSSADNPPQVILVTSGSAREGKTVTAINQALTLAQAGGRVLMIDADIRKPRLHKVFNLPNGHGLSTYLSGQSPLERIVHEVSLKGHGGFPLGGNGDAAGASGGQLSVIPSGPMPPNPAELLGSRRMRETLETLRGDYDYVVIDTPPVLPVTDTILLAALSDGVILVVRGQETPIDVAVKSRDRLTYARAKILGVVLNDVDVTSGDYYQYQRYYYSYYADQDGEAAGT